MANVNAILSRLVASLTASDPSWDVSVGSPTYTILESVATELANATNNSTLQTYSFDVNSKSGAELDAFVNIFGMTRNLGTRAYGTVTFTLSSPATSIITILQGTQVYVPSTTSPLNANIYFSTTVPATFAIGQTEVQVPVQSLLPGSFNNVAAGAINTVLTPIVGLPTVNNFSPIVGGTDTETDTQLQNRFSATAFSNISGTVDKFTSVVLQDPNVSQVNVVGAQQNYNEQIQVQTILSGNSTFNLGLNFQATLSVTSGSTLATYASGSFPAYITVGSGAYTTIPSPQSTVFSGSIYYDGTNYNLSAAPVNSGTLTINYTLSSGITGGIATLNGSTTAATVASTVSGFFAYLNIPGISVTTSGNTVVSGITVQLNQPTGYNVIVSSGTISGYNTITSAVPDSKYTYPEGAESIGLNLGSASQQLLTNNTDYVYPTGSGVPLVVKLNPNTGNAPLTYTGNFLQMISQYVPTSSRISNPTVNSNYVDIFINGTASNSTTEQIIFQPSVTFNSTSGSALNSSNFVFANGLTCASGTKANQGDYYIGFTNRPATNFPAQLISGNAPSFITFGTTTGNIYVPICLEYVNLAGAGGQPPVVSGIIATSGNNYLTTNTSISGLYVGLVISGTGVVNGTAVSTTLSGIPFGSYITQLIPGAPNRIFLNNTMTANISGIGTFVTLGYPVYDATNNAGSIVDATGIGIDSNEQVGYRAYGIPPFTGVNMVGSISHSYNSDVVITNDLAQQSRVVGTNVLVRQAQFLNLIVNLSIVYAQSANVSFVNNTIETAISQYLSSVPYTGTVNINSLISSVLNVPGVISARISTSTDNPNNYGIQTVAINGTPIATYTKNILLYNNQLASLYGVNITTFGIANF